jgi:prolyl-tRNA synthetase
MKYSNSFVKTLRQAPKEAETVNHKLLTQAGYVDQLMGGVYTYLPLGLRVLRNIEQIVREEMNMLGTEEVLMPMLHPKANWEITGGWDKIDVLFKIKSRTGKDYALGQSEEEIVTPLVMSRVSTYKDLPKAVYQIHWKFRDELRAQAGILRGREFLMKDMYSFHETQEDFDRFYDLTKKAYIKVFERLDLTAKVTEASGGAFSEKISYEFMVLTDAAWDKVFYCDNCDFCVNEEVASVKLGDKCPRCCIEGLKQATAAEVGNVFDLGQKYGKDFDLSFIGRDREKHRPFMGCFGIGVSRIMGVIAEKFHDEKGLIWPKSVSPFTVHLVGLDLENSAVKEQADELYKKLQEDNIEVFYDDRLKSSAGEKFADADLIGVSYRAVISEKTKNNIEVKKRAGQETTMLSYDDLVKILRT